MKTKLAFLLIIILAGFLRLYQLNGYPPSFWQDITANGYDAYSILKTGKDQWGTSFPFPLIKSLGDYKTALPVYFLIPGIKLFGLNEFGVRINMAVIGVLTVILAYFIGKKIGRSSTSGLILSFLLAVSPWQIGLTRHGWEAVLGIFFFPSGLYFLLSQNIKTSGVVLASLLFGISSYAYHPFRVFVPAFFGLVILLCLKEKAVSKRNFLLSIIIFSLIFLPNLLSLLSPSGQVRINVNRFDKTAEFIQQIKNHNALSANLTLVSFAVRNYFRLFSSDFLFVWGSTDPVFEIKDRGLTYFWLIPFTAYGLYILVKRKNLMDKILLIWLLLSPVPTIIVNNPYNLVKISQLLPLLEIITTIGFMELFNAKICKQRKLLISIIFLPLIIFSVTKYFVDYYATYPLYSSSWYQGVEKNTFTAIDAHKDKYQKIILSQKLEPYIYLLFYEKIDPQYYQTTQDKKLVMVGNFDEAHLKNLGKFSYSTGIEKDISVNSLYAFPLSEIPHPNGYQPVILRQIKDYLGNDKIAIFSWKKAVAL